MFKTLKNAWKTPELQKKMLFTLFIVLLYRLGACICVPYVSANISTSFESLYGSSVLGLMSILSGGAMQYATLFALSVSPYITASIVIQLLTIAIPALERWAKDGANGQKKIAALTRYVTVALALVTSYGYSMLLKTQGWLVKSDVFAMFVINASFCAGAALVMWLAELINEKGIGNGISIILFANIVSTLPGMVISMWDGIIMNSYVSSKPVSILIGAAITLAVLALVVATIGFVVWVTNSERRIPIQYAKRVVGRKMYGGQATNLPIKLNMTGVMPIIFASSIVSIPATIVAFIPQGKWKGFVSFVESFLSPTAWPYLVLYLLLIIAFSYFYVMISFNPVEVANNIAANGGSVRGMRPGRPTVQYIQKILKRVTLIGAFFLCIVAGLPMLVTVVTTAISTLNPTLAQKLPDLSILTFGGSSLLIVVGVALETVRDLEAQLSLRASKGFLG